MVAACASPSHGTQLASDETYALWADAQNAYWIDKAGVLKAAALTGGDPMILASRITGDLVGDDDALYVSQQAGSGAELMRIAKADGSAATIAAFGATRLALAGDTLVGTTMTGQPFALSLGTGAVQMFPGEPKGWYIPDVAVDGTNMYWNEDMPFMGARSCVVQPLTGVPSHVLPGCGNLDLTAADGYVFSVSRVEQESIPDTGMSVNRHDVTSADERIVATGELPRFPAVVGGRLYWAFATSIERSKLAGADRLTLAVTDGYPSALAVSAAAVVWSTPSGIWAVDLH